MSVSSSELGHVRYFQHDFRRHDRGLVRIRPVHRNRRARRQNSDVQVKSTRLLGFGGTIQGSGGITLGNRQLPFIDRGHHLYRRHDQPRRLLVNLVSIRPRCDCGIQHPEHHVRRGLCFCGFNSNIRTLQGIAGSTFQIDGTLTLTDASTAFDGAIVNLHNNSSNLTLTAGHQTLDGINTYTGNTTVNGGTLTVNGSIASSFDGHGLCRRHARRQRHRRQHHRSTAARCRRAIRIGIADGAGQPRPSRRHRPTWCEVSPANADRANVVGRRDAGRRDGQRTSYATGSYVAQQYTILNAAGGVGGTFSGLVNTNLPSTLQRRLSYDRQHTSISISTLNLRPRRRRPQRQSGNGRQCVHRFLQQPPAAFRSCSAR